MVSTFNSATVGTLNPTGQIDVPSVLDQLKDLNDPSLSIVTQSKPVIKLFPALFMSVALAVVAALVRTWCPSAFLPHW